MFTRKYACTIISLSLSPVDTYEATGICSMQHRCHIFINFAHTKKQNNNDALNQNHYFLLLRNTILLQCLSISCSVCEQKWYVCINCYSQLKHIKTLLQYKRHAKLCHENNVCPTLQHKSQNTYHIKLKDFKLQFV